MPGLWQDEGLDGCECSGLWWDEGLDNVVSAWALEG